MALHALGRKVLVFMPESALKEVHTSHTMGMSQKIASAAISRLNRTFQSFFRNRLLLIDIPPPYHRES